MTKQTEQFHWTVKCSNPAILGAAEIGGEQTLDWIRNTIGINLDDLESRYPITNPSIAKIRLSLDSTNGYFWNRTLMVQTGISYANITFQIEQVKAPKPNPGSSAAPAAPRKRADDELRERYREHLSTSFQAGRLRSDEFSDRLDKVLESVYEDELPSLIEDLDPLPPKQEAVVVKQEARWSNRAPTRAEYAGFTLTMMAFICAIIGALATRSVVNTLDPVAAMLLIVGAGIVALRPRK